MAAGIAALAEVAMFACPMLTAYLGVRFGWTCPAGIRRRKR